MSELKSYLCIEAKAIETKDAFGYRFTVATKPAPEACVKEVYIKDEADSVIAELKDKVEMHDFFWEGCGFDKRGFKNTIAVSEAFDRLEAENKALKEALRWRKCSEEMPKSDIKQYLVYDTKTKKYGKSFCSHSLKNFQFPVTHWMPLPKAPEEGK